MEPKEITFHWSDGLKTTYETAYVLPGDAAKPIIVLLHGNNGTIDDMRDPAVHPKCNYDYGAIVSGPVDRGWHFYPGIWYWSVEPDPYKPVTGWQPFLGARGYRTVNYAQVDPAGSLIRPVYQLTGLLYQLRDDFPWTRIVLLAHSRGGLLARATLWFNPDLANRVTHLVTLHSPHAGSSLANTAVVASAVLPTLAQLTAAAPGVVPLVDMLQAEVSSPSYVEMSIGSQTLTDIGASEPIPGITYITFGGTSVLYTRMYQHAFHWSSALPQFHIPPFHWITVPQPLPLAGVLLDALPNVAPEITEGVGDGLVTDANSRLPPFALHITVGLNHAEALWDPSLKNLVTGILDVIPPLPAEDAAYVTSTVPKQMVAGQLSTVSITMKNTGATLWTPAPPLRVRLVSRVPANQLGWGGREVPLPAGMSVVPGDQATFTFDVRAPFTPGSYPFQWQMMQETSYLFGESTPPMSIDVVVNREEQCTTYQQRIDALRAKLTDLRTERDQFDREEDHQLRQYLSMQIMDAERELARLRQLAFLAGCAEGGG